MSYGSAAGVAALSQMWTSNGEFTVSTKPTLAQVNSWLAQVSAGLDAALSDEGFETPATDSDVTPMLDLLVNGITKDLVDYSHGAGRFFVKKALDSGTSPFMVIDAELHEWVKRKSIGLEALGLVKRSGVIGRSVASFDLM